MLMNNVIKELTHGFQNCNTSQILMFHRYVKVRESLYTNVIIWVKPYYIILMLCNSTTYKVFCKIYSSVLLVLYKFHTSLMLVLGNTQIMNSSKVVVWKF